MRSFLPFFARRGFTSPFGKVLRPLGTLRVRADTDELIRAEAARLGLPPLEFVREYLEIGLHGRGVVEHERTIRLDRIEQLLPKGNRKEPSSK